LCGQVFVSIKDSPYMARSRGLWRARKLDAGPHQSAEGTLHVDPRWRWYRTTAGGGKLRAG
jgi:hypothetical protein